MREREREGERTRCIETSTNRSKTEKNEHHIVWHTQSKQQHDYYTNRHSVIIIIHFSHIFFFYSAFVAVFCSLNKSKTSDCVYYSERARATRRTFTTHGYRDRIACTVSHIDGDGGGGRVFCVCGSALVRVVVFFFISLWMSEWMKAFQFIIIIVILFYTIIL